MKTDIVYGKGGGRDLLLDLFSPKESGSDRPAIVYIHGGGWRGGNRSQFYRQAAHLAAKGVVGACVEYRLSGEATFPAAVHDVKCAVRWLRANADDVGVDPDRVGAAGGSAGGHLAAMLASTPHIAELEGEGGHPGHSSAVQLLVPFNPATDMRSFEHRSGGSNAVTDFLGGSPEDAPDAYDLASPIHHITADHPPTLLFHGTGDTTVPFSHSSEYEARLEQLRVRVELFAAEGAPHGFFNSSPHFETTLQRMEEFVLEQFGTIAD